MKNFLEPPHPIERIEESRIPKVYSQKRIQVFLGIFFGYAAFYLVRKNFSLAMPYFEEHLGIDKTSLGFAFSLNAIAYGLSKFIMGGVSDRSDARKFLPLGLILASLAIILAGSSLGVSNLFMMGLSQFLIGWMGGMGWPPAGRVMTHWFSQKERGTWMAFWNTAHNVGGAAIAPISAFAFNLFIAWKWDELTSIRYGIFVVPAVIAILVAVLAYFLIRDNPQSVGLPTIEEYKNDYPKNYSKEHEETLTTKEIIFKYVLTNKVLWYIALANVFVYLVRYGVLDWAATYLKQVKGYDIKDIGLAYAWYELAAIPGTIICGIVSDKVFKGNRSLTNILFMFLTMCAVILYWQNGHSPLLNHFYSLFTNNLHKAVLFMDNIALLLIGFLIYGPIMLIGVQALDLSQKNAAGASAGFTGFFGYIFGTALLANTALAYIIEHDHTWTTYFYVLIGSCVIAMVLMLLTNKRERELYTQKK